MKPGDVASFLRAYGSFGHAPFFRFRDFRAWAQGSGAASRKKELADKEAGGVFDWAVQAGFVIHVAEDVYGPGYGWENITAPVGDIVHAFRGSCRNYHSLESRLSESGVISEFALRHTFMTTGKSGIVKTPLGTVEFVHYERPGWRETVWDPSRRIEMATCRQAYKDLKEIGRNVDLVDFEELVDACREEREMARKARHEKSLRDRLAASL